MGAKYRPTVKDQKASLRFQRLQAEKLKTQKALRAVPRPAPAQPAQPSGPAQG